MMEEVDELVVRVRADTAAFRRDVEDMRAQLDGPLSAGVEKAGRLIERSLAPAIRTGKVSFDDLKSVALKALAEIAAARRTEERLYLAPEPGTDQRMASQNAQAPARSSRRAGSYATAHGT